MAPVEFVKAPKRHARDATGIFDMVERSNAEKVANGKKSGPLFIEPDWKHRIVKYFRDNNLDGKTIVESELKAVTSEILGIFGGNKKLAGGIKGTLGKLKACNAHNILEA
eukprot:186577_1